MKRLQEELFSSPAKKKTPTTTLKKEPVKEIKKVVKKLPIKEIPKPVIKKPVVSKPINEFKKKLLEEKKITPIQKVEKPIIEKDKPVKKDVLAKEKTTKLIDNNNLSPLDKIRLAKKLKEQHSAEGKAKNLIARLKKQQAEFVIIQKEENTNHPIKKKQVQRKR